MPHTNGTWNLKQRKDGKTPLWAGLRGKYISFSLGVSISLEECFSSCSADPLSNMLLQFDSREEAIAFAVRNGELFDACDPYNTVVLESSLACQAYPSTLRKIREGLVDLVM